MVRRASGMGEVVNWLSRWLWRQKRKVLEHNVQTARLEYNLAARLLLEHEAKGREPKRKLAWTHKLWRLER